MFTKKKTIIFMTRFAAMIGLTEGLTMADGWLIGLTFCAIAIIFLFVVPSLIVRLFLKKDEREEVDGELYLWDYDGRVEYKLTINAVGEVPYKEFLKIRINESARDESLKK